jgi:two-component system OmpR family response regulator
MRSLVIEDEPQIGAYLERLLGALNGVVDVVGSVMDARHALANFKYDLAIVDRMLPDGDALGIVAALSILPERPAIMQPTAECSILPPREDAGPRPASALRSLLRNRPGTQIRQC